MDIRFYVLDALYVSGLHCSYSGLLNKVMQMYSMPGEVTRSVLAEMARGGLVSGTFRAYGDVQISRQSKPCA